MLTLYIYTLALQKRISVWYIQLWGNDSESFNDVKETPQSTTVILSYITHCVPAELHIVPLTQQYLATLTCNKNFCKTTYKRNSNIWNSGQAMSEAQCYAVYILVPGGHFTFGRRTSDIHWTGNTAGPTDFLQMTEKNSQGQPENKFSIHSPKFEFQTVIATTESLYQVLGTAFILPVERRLSCAINHHVTTVYTSRLKFCFSAGNEW